MYIYYCLGHTELFWQTVYRQVRTSTDIFVKTETMSVLRLTSRVL